MGDNQLSEYELLRERNIAQFRAQYKLMFGEELGATSVSKLTPTVKLTRRSGDSSDESSSDEDTNTSSRRHKRRQSNRSLYPTRRSKRLSSKPLVFYDSDNEDSDVIIKRCKNIIRRRLEDRDHTKWYVISSDESDYDNETKDFLGFKDLFRGFENIQKEQRKKYTFRKSMPKISLRTPREFLSPDDVTENDLKNITYSSVNKVYDSVNGSTCHQCRQKTKDTKSACRDPHCVGVRGQFCGFCLKSRYGEDVAVVLKDPTWSCPPCRDICNCSICRTRIGKLPTGIVAPQALSQGFNSVKEFLESHEDD